MGDPRRASDKELESLYYDFLIAYVCESCGEVRSEDDAESKATALIPDGCTCPNNGGGDCPWCLAKEEAMDWQPEPGEQFICASCDKKAAGKP